MDSLMQVGLALLAYLLYGAYTIYRGWQKGRINYAVKQFINGFRPIVSLFIVFYVIIIGVWGIQAVSSAADKQVASLTDGLGKLLVGWSPDALVIFIIYIAFRLGKIAMNPIIRYTDQEKLWERESSLKFRSKLPKPLQRFVKVS